MVTCTQHRLRPRSSWPPGHMRSGGPSEPEVRSRRGTAWGWGMGVGAEAPPLPAVASAPTAAPAAPQTPARDPGLSGRPALLRRGRHPPPSPGRSSEPGPHWAWTCSMKAAYRAVFPARSSTHALEISPPDEQAAAATGVGHALPQTRLLRPPRGAGQSCPRAPRASAGLLDAAYHAGSGACFHPIV